MSAAPAVGPVAAEHDREREPSPKPREERRELTIAGWFALTRGVLLVVAVLGGVAGLLALSALSTARTTLLDQVAPLNSASQALQLAIVNEETGLRGYLLTDEERFLEPYRTGTREAQAAASALTAAAKPLGVEALVQRTLDAADDWRSQYAEPTLRRAQAGAARPTVAQSLQGKASFDEFRSVNAQLRAEVDGLRADKRSALTDTATTVRWIFIAFIVAILLSVLGTAVVLRRQVIGPITALARRVRRVAGGDHGATVDATGAREIHELGSDIEDMRIRIVSEVEQLEAAQVDLKRSNTELEQFAYVASHDLQEPLRKVASFCQMLQRRYGGQLDERGEQYIEFAVDGAKRMQDLINDLLSFSRVGRITEAQTVIDGDEIMARVRTSLAEAIAETGAVIEAEPLPRVRGEASLLTLVFQNLVANGLKFRAEDVTPRVQVSVRRAGDLWEFTVADNGIGIDDEYADRIFIIFQRLHPRSAYEGTGIGLAMCRKVVEHHGGTIWLDTDDASPGATFHFTLPVLEEELQS